MRIVMLFSALSLSACGRPATQSAPDAASTTPSAAPSTIPAVYGKFEKGANRARFASEFVRGLEITQGAERFFLPLDYQWKLEEAIKKTGVGAEVPETILRQTDNAVLVKALEQLYSDWGHKALPEEDRKLYHSIYIQELYRHYRNLRYLEVLPDQPAGKGKGDIEKLVKVWNDLDQKTWKLTEASPFFGIKKDPSTAGPFEKPLMPMVQSLMAELIEQSPNHDSDDFKTYYLSKIQFAVLDMVLPGLFLDAIRDRMKRAGITAEEAGFSESDFEAELKEAFLARGKFFAQNGIKFASDRTERRIMELLSDKFKELGKMEHPLEIYRHN